MTTDLAGPRKRCGIVRSGIYTAKAMQIIPSLDLPAPRIVECHPYRSSWTLISKTQIGERKGPHSHSARLAELLGKLTPLDARKGVKALSPFEFDGPCCSSGTTEAYVNLEPSHPDYCKVYWDAPRTASENDETPIEEIIRLSNWALNLKSPTLRKKVLYSPLDFSRPSTPVTPFPEPHIERMAPRDSVKRSYSWSPAMPDPVIPALEIERVTEKQSEPIPDQLKIGRRRYTVRYGDR